MPSKNVKKLLDNHLQNLYSELSSSSVTGQDRKDLVAELIALSKMQCTIEENDAKIKLDFEKEEHSYDLKKMESDRDFSNKNDELSIEKAKIEREIALKEDENKIRFSEEERAKIEKNKPPEPIPEKNLILEDCLLFQRLLRGRKEQLLMQEGKKNRFELIKELKIFFTSIMCNAMRSAIWA